MTMMIMEVNEEHRETKREGGKTGTNGRQTEDWRGNTETYLSDGFLASSGCLSCRISTMLGCRRNATILSL